MFYCCCVINHLFWNKTLNSDFDREDGSFLWSFETTINEIQVWGGEHAELNKVTLNAFSSKKSDSESIKYSNHEEQEDGPKFFSKPLWLFSLIKRSEKNSANYSSAIGISTLGSVPQRGWFHNSKWQIDFFGRVNPLVHPVLSLQR